MVFLGLFSLPSLSFGALSLLLFIRYAPIATSESLDVIAKFSIVNQTLDVGAKLPVVFRYVTVVLVKFVVFPTFDAIIF